MRSLWPLALLCALGSTACGPAPAPVSPLKAVPAQASRFAADPRVGVYVSTPWGFSTSSYWIEGPDGLIVIDTQFLPSAAAELIERAEATTGKPVKLAIVLHPNPDKFNGVATFQARGIRVVTAQQVADLIPAIHLQRRGRFYEEHQPDYPYETPVPEVFGATTTELSAGGVTVTAHVLPGPGCSKAHVVVTFDGHVFPGDLVAHQHHGWLEIGETPAWRQRLQEIQALQPRFVHPGRGASGGPEVLAAMDAYLAFAIERVAAHRAEGQPLAAGVQAVIADIKARYPGFGHPYFLQIGVPAEWRRQDAEGG